MMYWEHEMGVVQFEATDTYADLGSDSNITPLPGVDVSGLSVSSEDWA